MENALMDFCNYFSLSITRVNLKLNNSSNQ
jgi:hypothetical protein